MLDSLLQSLDSRLGDVGKRDNVFDAH